MINPLIKNTDGNDTPNIGKYKRVIFESFSRSIFKNPTCMIGWENEQSHYQNQFQECNYFFWFEHESNCNEALLP